MQSRQPSGLYQQELGQLILKFFSGYNPDGLPEGRSISMHFEIGGAHEDWGYRVTVNNKTFEHKYLIEALCMAANNES